MKRASGVVLLDTMLALVVFSVAILTIVVVIGDILRADTRLKSVDELSSRMIAARQIVLDANFNEVDQNTSDTKSWTLTSSARAERTNQIQAQTGIPLKITLLGPTGDDLTSFGMIKTP